jgi:hypothetical protein
MYWLLLSTCNIHSLACGWRQREVIFLRSENCLGGLLYTDEGVRDGKVKNEYRKVRKKERERTKKRESEFQMRGIQRETNFTKTSYADDIETKAKLKP